MNTCIQVELSALRKLCRVCRESFPNWLRLKGPPSGMHGETLQASSALFAGRAGGRGLFPQRPISSLSQRLHLSLMLCPECCWARWSVVRHHFPGDRLSPCVSAEHLQGVGLYTVSLGLRGQRQQGSRTLQALPCPPNRPWWLSSSFPQAACPLLLVLWVSEPTLSPGKSARSLVGRPCVGLAALTQCAGLRPLLPRPRTPHD